MEPLLHREPHRAVPRELAGLGRKECPMSGTLCLVLMLLWDLGRVSDWTLGGWLHLLPLLAVAIVLLNIRAAVGQSHPRAEDTVPDPWPSTDQHHEREMIRGAHTPLSAAWSARGGEWYSVDGKSWVNLAK
jgi:hypothetical protein